MKKVININFQGQIIPIEETAYEMLREYIASLRNYFMSEEGRDEIINDIESRIAELFGEQLKKGAPCITDIELNRIIDNMGRPADIAAEEEGIGMGSTNQSNKRSGSGSTGGTGSSQTGSSSFPPFEQKRLYRNEQDKVIAGVASGLANYLHIDPAIIRVIFALLAIFGGSGILAYIIFWIVLPSRSMVTNVRKRLFRDADDKVIAGVGGGLAKYFDISPAIPRIIFAAPFILGIIASITGSFFPFYPGIVGQFGGGTFILAYIILWIVLPVARTASEKLEMKGEKVDFNSIRDTIVGDIEGLKTRAQTAGSEMKESATKFGGEIKDTLSAKSSQLGPEIGYAAKRSSTGIAHAIGILIKAFVYFVVGIVAFALFMAAIGLLVAGVSVFPLHDFLLQGTLQYFAAWGTLLLFLGVPLIALLVTLIRRIMGIKKSNPYIGYSFTALWIIGLICIISLFGTLNRSFSTQVGVREEVTIAQPANKLLKVTTADNNVVYYNNWFDFDGLMSISRDTLNLATVKVDVVKSEDSLYHVYLIKESQGSDNDQARNRAEKIRFDIIQKGNTLYLPAQFMVGRTEKWRNQKVVVVIEVPENYSIELDESLDDYHYFNVQFNRRNRNNGYWERNWDRGVRNYDKNTKLEMRTEGLRNMQNRSRNNDSEEKSREETPLEQSIPDSLNQEAPAKKTTTESIYKYSKIDPKKEVEMPPYGAIMGNPLSAMLRF